MSESEDAQGLLAGMGQDVVTKDVASVKFGDVKLNTES